MQPACRVPGAGFYPCPNVKERTTDVLCRRPRKVLHERCEASGTLPPGLRLFVLPSSALSSSGLAPRAEGLPAPRMMATDDQFAGRRSGVQHRPGSG